MHISIILFVLFILGVGTICFFFGYCLNSMFRDMERADVQVLENGIIDRDIRIRELEDKME